MKKYLLLCASVGLVSLNAQIESPGPRDESKLHLTPAKSLIKQRGTNPVADTLGASWFECANAVNTFTAGGNANFSYATIFPDTNAYFTYSGGTGNPSVTRSNNVNSMGIVIDPRSTLYETAGPFKLYRWNTYHVDSVRFQVFYKRFNPNPNILDTIVVTTFDRTSMSRSFTTIYAGAVDYTTNKFTAMGTNASTQYVSLGASDTFSGGVVITLPVKKTVNGSDAGANWFGAAISFIPGYKGYNHAAPFDTVADFTKTGPYDSSKTSNVLRLLTYYDPSKYVEDVNIPANAGARIYNHGIVAEPTQRYKILQSGQVVNYFYPAFYTTSHAFPVIDFLITSYNAANKQIDGNGNAVGNAYPNPTNGAMAFTVPFKLAASSNVTINVHDMNGRLVRSNSGKFSAGAGEMSFSTGNLTNGIYVYEMITGAFKTSGKIVVQ